MRMLPGFAAVCFADDTPAIWCEIFIFSWFSIAKKKVDYIKGILLFDRLVMLICISGWGVTRNFILILFDVKGMITEFGNCDHEENLNYITE